MMSVTTPADGASRQAARRRLGPTVDTTPLVDIAFLLLTFFLFASTMSKPSVMEMAVPPMLIEQVAETGRVVELLLPARGELRGRIDGHAVGARGDALLVDVASMLGRNSGVARIELRVERDVPHARLVALLDRLQVRGIDPASVSVAAAERVHSG